ncbi:HlyD family efflux transporter periplasmic adaptor subunit [Pseudovibrio exalbescens]|uniref:efflux RND transporter periplasmic adaptor subunit n=1 Tax=Pseudovibrio exalbescens TaxID=197461 RepID=UPI0023651273|nr:HlyD family efflux transporter periplasmic adaptor subunit [Pseudovibrio exalbescens]MDD7910981.1 HlyD family efflux transporter periplasmic adaptor subunit [Pseudovibrio exalbescens]
MAKKKRSRLILTTGALVLLGAALTYSFWPQPTPVDMGVAERGPMVVTITEEGRTRVHDAYVVSTPVTGRLLRVGVLPGDPVVRGETVVAQMLPTNPSALDVRTREQARAAVTAAEAALRVARADLNKAIADMELRESDLNRVKKLIDSGTVSQVVYERALREARLAQATMDTAEAAISMREAELANTRARLISFNDPAHAAQVDAMEGIPLFAPATGRILQVMQKSETTLPVGTPIMEIGDVTSDLEIVVELLSTDAVQVSAGDRVIIDAWGGDEPLNGVVDRVDPWGFTKFSALGVEEQRVNAVVHFTDPAETRQSLGHGYRIEAQIVVWENDNALKIPSNALFRDGTNWAVFAVEDGIARLKTVEVGQNNGIHAQILSGLEEGNTLIQYPASGIEDGLKVIPRHMGE